MSTKSALKASKTAIEAKKWDDAKEQASIVLEKDPQNYWANLFIGRANEGLGKFDDAAKGYTDATKIKPEEPNAWLGLRGLYEKQTTAKVDENTQVGLKLAELFAEVDDAHKSQSAIDKLVDFARKHGTKLQYARALETQLPASPVYAYLEGRLPNPAAVYTRLAEIHETEENNTINKNIAERKTRLGATAESVNIQVKQEVYGPSPLEGIYEQIINWTSDDELRREYEERLLQRAYDTMIVLPAGKKAEKRDKVLKLAHDMVVIKHPFLLAWDIELEWRSSGVGVEAY
jgi:tetratricopeptide (TPR) repeat protein